MEEEKKPGRKPGTHKTGGRKKGTENKITKDVRLRLSKFFEDDWEQAVKDWKFLTPEERWKYRASMQKYVAPAMAAVDVNDTSNAKSNTVLKIVSTVMGNSEEQ